MDDLIERLHALSRYEHSDYSIGDEAATEIEALRAEVEQMTNMARMQAARADATERGARHHKTRAERLAETLRDARDRMLGQVKWVACDCGCERDKPADAASVVWLRAIALLRDQEADNG